MPPKVKMGEIEKGLSDCETKLDTAISAFQASEPVSSIQSSYR